MGFRQRHSKSMSEFKGETLIPTWKLLDGSKSYTPDHRTLHFPRLMHTHTTPKQNSNESSSKVQLLTQYSSSWRGGGGAGVVRAGVDEL